MNEDSQPRFCSLSEICADIFSLVLLLQSSEDFGELNIFHKTVRLIEEMEAKARGLNIAEDNIEDAKFALVALIDETIMVSVWASKHAWHLLQAQYFNTTMAGDQFFERLDKLLGNPEKTEVLEVYYLCLVLGFEGRLVHASKEEYQSYIDRLCKNIDLQSMDKLSTNSLSGKFLLEHKRIPWWALAAMSFCAVTTIIIVLATLI